MESYVNNHMSVWGKRWQGNDIVFVHVEMSSVYGDAEAGRKPVGVMCGDSPGIT